MTSRLIYKHSVITKNIETPVPVILGTPKGQYVTGISCETPGVTVRLPDSSDFRCDRKIAYNNIGEYLELIYDNRQGTETCTLIVFVDAKIVGTALIRIYLSDWTVLCTEIEIRDDISSQYVSLNVEKKLCSLAISNYVN